jgi:predicted nucleotidyltransferase
VTDEKVTRVIQDLEFERHLTVEMRRSNRGNRVQWTATLSGVWFLDGPWSETKTGYAKNRKKAMREVERAFRR